MDLNEKAEEAATVYSVSDAADAAGMFVLTDTELVPSDDIGSEKYPQYGDWLPVERHIDGVKNEDTYLEVPQALAAALVEAEADEDSVVDVQGASKTRDGVWEVDVEVQDG